MKPHQPHDEQQDDDEPASRGRPEKTVRWTVEHAATEFGPDRRTLAKRLRDAGVVKGADGKYSTQDICRAIYEAESARDAKDRQHTELLRVQTENARRERIPIGLVEALWDAAIQGTAAALKAHKNKNLTPAKINEILGTLRSAKLPVKW